MNRKIFIIGFNKTATRSLSQIMRHNNYVTLHGGGAAACQQFKKNIKKNKPILTGYTKYDCYSDNEVLIHNFKLLDKQYPKSIFILNIRNINDWVCSRLNHMLRRGGAFGYIKYYRALYNLDDLSNKKIIQHWINDNNTHYNNAVTYFKNRPKFMIYDINKNIPQDLKKVLPSLKIPSTNPKITNKVIGNIGKWKYINNEYVFLKPNNFNPIHTIKL